MIPWTWLIAIYLWGAGMAGGAYFVAFLGERLGLGDKDGLLKAATWMGVLAVMIGSLILTVDLGKPLRFWHLLSEFNVLSPMSIGAWLLPAWALVGALMIGLWWLDRWTGALKVLAWLNFVLSVLLIAYTGVLLSATNQPLWSSTLLLPALFVVTSISRGTAFLLLFVLCRKRVSPRTFTFLGRSDVVLYILDLIALAAFLVWLGPAGQVITTGTLGLLLWIGVVVIGILIPLAVGVRSIIWGKKVGPASVLVALWAIVGGLILRAVIVLGGQIYS